MMADTGLGPTEWSAQILSLLAICANIRNLQKYMTIKISTP